VVILYINNVVHWQLLKLKLTFMHRILRFHAEYVRHLETSTFQLCKDPFTTSGVNRDNHSTRHKTAGNYSVRENRFSANIVPQAAYAAIAAPCITDRAGVQQRPQPKPAIADFGLQP